MLASSLSLAVPLPDPAYGSLLGEFSDFHSEGVARRRRHHGPVRLRWDTPSSIGQRGERDASREARKRAARHEIGATQHSAHK